jgi:hypothetical protein
MKKLNLLMMALGGALVLSLSSCDPCKDVDCGTEGTCEDGSCVCNDKYYGDACETHCMNGTYSEGTCTCDNGYEGDACDVEERAEFLATYNADDNCESGTYTYESTITAGTAIDAISISNFAGFDVTVPATVDGSSFTITNHVDAAGRKFNGTGTISASGTTVTLEYDVVFTDETTDACTATLTKQ